MLCHHKVGSCTVACSSKKHLEKLDELRAQLEAELDGEESSADEQASSVDDYQSAEDAASSPERAGAAEPGGVPLMTTMIKMTKTQKSLIKFEANEWVAGRGCSQLAACHCEVERQICRLLSFCQHRCGQDQGPASLLEADDYVPQQSLHMQRHACAAAMRAAPVRLAVAPSG